MDEVRSNIVQNPGMDIPPEAKEECIREILANVFLKDGATNVNACNIIYRHYSGKIICEKISDMRFNFYLRKEGTCYWEPFNQIKTLICKTLEREIDKSFQTMRDKCLNQDEMKKLLKLYSSAIMRVQDESFLRRTSLLLAERVLVFPRIPWNDTPECLPCLDKVLDFSGDGITLRDARENEYFCNPLPCNALDVSESKKSDIFEEFVSELFDDDRTKKTLRHCLSLCISGSPSKITQIWFNSAGDGGKNTVFDFLADLIPGRITMLAPSVITLKGDSGERRFGMAGAEGKTGLFFDEASAEIDICKIKNLTGLSQVNIEKKGRDQYGFEQTWSLVMLCNRLPKFRPADDSAFLSRLLVLPFPFVFVQNEMMRDLKLKAGVKPEHIKQAGDKEKIISALMQDRPAIIRELIEAWQDCRDNFGKVPYKAPSCIVAAEEYRQENDDIERFFDEYYQEGPTESFVTYSRIIETYKEFSGNGHFKSTNWLIKSLLAKYQFLRRWRSNGDRVLKGVIEKTEDEKNEYVKKLARIGRVNDAE